MAAGVAEEGQYRGERVLAQTEVASLLDDPGADMSDPRGEDGEDELGSHSVRDATKSVGELALNQVQAVMERLTDLPKSHLERVLKRLMLMQYVEVQALRDEVRAEFPEPAHQYAALLALVERLRAESAPVGRIEAAEQALQDLERDQGPAIRAALNVSEVVADYASDQLAEIQTLRDTYRDVVLDQSDLGQTLRTLIDQFGEQDLHRSMQFLLRATAADLASDGSSIDPVKLNSILNDLYRLELLTGLQEHCEELIARYGAPGVAYRASDLLGELLTLQSTAWLHPEQIEPLPEKLGAREIGDQIGVLREFKSIARQIPLKVYSDPEQRTRLLDAIQQAMDAAIDREDAEEEFGE